MVNALSLSLSYTHLTPHSLLYKNAVDWIFAIAASSGAIFMFFRFIQFELNEDDNIIKCCH